MTAWQSPETAPKDGTDFLAVWATGQQTAYGVIRWDGTEWCEGLMCAVHDFTAWMPLPAPPVTP